MSPGNQLADGALARIEGFTPNGRQKTDELLLAGDMGVQDLEHVLAAIASRQFGLSFHDALYPSLTDPGAYFAYVRPPGTAPESWAMSYGNHGWSGGIYQVGQPTLIRQIHHLVAEGHLDKMRFGAVSLLARYALKSPAESAAKDKEILALHA